MKSIHTLIPDIYELLLKKDWFTEEIADEFGKEVSRRLQEQFTSKRPRGLRLSKLGPICSCALWYSVNAPELAEAMPPWAMNKFSYGHILEAWAICLAKAAGHTVTGEQDELSVDGIVGHRDCVIDGCIVDVKSCNSYSFAKFKEKTIAQDDAFGYLDQLDGYLEGSADDPLVLDKNKAYLWGIDKTLGHMVLYEHTRRPNHIRKRIERYKEIVGRVHPPACTCESVPDGKSGNLKLGVKASYSPFKFNCFPYLRTFLYSDGPRYLTKVVRLPDVTEINKDGKVIHT